jgi:hypothetical protein
VVDIVSPMFAASGLDCSVLRTPWHRCPLNQAARSFHKALVATCGNETMILVVGAL